MLLLPRLRMSWLRHAALCSALLLAAMGAPAQVPAPAPDAAVLRLRVVGGLAGVNQFTRWEQPFWTQELARLSGGRFTADIVPFDRAGVPDVEMLRLLQLGVVPFGTMLMSAMATQYPQYTAPDLAGLNPDMASLRASVAAFRPYLEKTLRERHGVEALAIYVYPAQVLFCKRPLTALADLAGRRTRVSSTTQADFVGAVGGVAVHTSFAQIAGALQSGNIECAITGTTSGRAVGLHTLTSHLYAMPLNWGLAIFGANRNAWDALPPELRAVLRRELPRLEARIWRESERETTESLACHSGAPSCASAAKGAMALVPVSAQDERRRVEIFRATVLPRWLMRCADGCADLWKYTIGEARGIALPATP
ncbi:TRAP transporter substrate-binding protein DctP [Rhodococcus sp. SRB_17]|uniref:TRAP transporter substrate-binding protein n=1 Tax=Acidovorax sp. SRB_24 TaxID=1962700 RepID=UPI00197FF69C